MIEFNHVSKRYRTVDGWKNVLLPTSLCLPKGRNIGLLGRNGTGKSTLLRLIAGSEAPTQGCIIRHVKLSWPLGFAGGFNATLTGEENLRFVCRIYGENIGRIRDFVLDFSELGRDLSMPLKTYSSGMKARLAFALSMAIDFDCYLIDEITGVGDRYFQDKCRAAFEDRRQVSNLIMVSHSMDTLRRHCDMGAVLEQGKLVLYDDIDLAIAAYLTQGALR